MRWTAGQTLSLAQCHTLRQKPLTTELHVEKELAPLFESYFARASQGAGSVMPAGSLTDLSFLEDAGGHDSGFSQIPPTQNTGLTDT